MKIKPLNIPTILLILLILLTKNYIISNSIPRLIILFLVVYLVFAIVSYIELGSLKKMFLSVDFIYETVFVFYSIAAAVMFVIDGYQPRIRYFLINESNIFGTLDIYFMINCLFIILILLFNGPKSFNISDDIMKNIDLSNKFSIWDFVAFLIVSYYYYLHFRNGLQILKCIFKICDY